MRGWIVAGLGMVLLGGCSSLGQVMAYESEVAARFVSDGRGFEVRVHPTEPRLLIQRDLAGAFWPGFVKGATFGAVDNLATYSAWETGARWLVEPAGCRVRDLRPILAESSWEFGYTCPPGIDLRALMTSQRVQLQNGAPIDLAR